MAIVDLSSGQTVSRTTSEGETGFVIPLPGLGSYSFEASAEEYLYGMTTYEQGGGMDLNRSPFVQIGLMPIEVGQTFKLEAIQLNRAFPSSARIIKRVVSIGTMDDGKSKGQRCIVGHTDNVGSVPFNMALSQDRAAAVERFLTERGVEAERIETQGDGPSNQWRTTRRTEAVP